MGCIRIEGTLKIICIVLSACVGLAGCANDRPMNVVIVTLDTTRADHIGCYGKVEASTPNIDALAAEGVLFENAFAPVPITLPSHSNSGPTLGTITRYRPSSRRIIPGDRPCPQQLATVGTPPSLSARMTGAMHRSIASSRPSIRTARCCCRWRTIWPQREAP